MTSLLDIRGLRVNYGQVTAIEDLSLSISDGEAVALIGANGSGKSTLMKTVIGLQSKAAGTLSFAGRALDGLTVPARARAGIGYCPENRRIFPGLTVRENLEVASFASAAETRHRLEFVVSIFPALAQFQSSVGWQLSGGQQQMLAIGRALMGRPRLLLLDEPSLGLSPLLTDEVLGRIRDIVTAGTAVLLAEQNVVKALDVVDRAYVLSLGHIVLAGSPADLSGNPMVVDAFLSGDGTFSIADDSTLDNGPSMHKISETASVAAAARVR